MADQPTSSGADLQQRYQQMLDLTPLAVALAGLPASEGRLLLEEQIEGRATTAKYAYRMARQLADEVAGGDPQKFRQFRDLLPLTLALAGLPSSGARLHNEDQIEARAITMRAAYRVARATARDCLGGS